MRDQEMARDLLPFMRSLMHDQKREDKRAFGMRGPSGERGQQRTGEIAPGNVRGEMLHFPRSPAVTCLLVLSLLLSLELPANAATHTHSSTPSTLTIGVLSLPKTLNPLLDPRALDPQL